jgi:hypothetical protein
MRSFLFSSILALACLILSAKAGAQTIQWGSSMFTTFEDSQGVTLDASYNFELGTFDNSFVPTLFNVDDWASNWRVFDTAVYNAALGVFSSTADMTPSGGSASPTGDASFDFQNLQAYIWIYNFNTPGPDTEWHLAAHNDWIFPEALEECCNNQPPVQWEINQTVEPDDPITTVPVVPEPSGALLVSIIGVLAILRRRRTRVAPRIFMTVTH